MKEDFINEFGVNLQDYVDENELDEDSVVETNVYDANGNILSHMENFNAD